MEQQRKEKLEKDRLRLERERERAIATSNSNSNVGGQGSNNGLSPNFVTAVGRIGNNNPIPVIPGSQSMQVLTGSAVLNTNGGHSSTLAIYDKNTSLSRQREDEKSRLAQPGPPTRFNNDIQANASRSKPKKKWHQRLCSCFSG